MKEITYGMVGGGPGSFIGEAHRRAINLDDSAKIVAGCFSRDAEKNLSTGVALRIPEDRCYSSYEQMAIMESQRPDPIDFVIVVTPNVTHYPICKTFLKAGIHVVCDKPLCFTTQQAQELCRLAEEKNLLFMVTYTYMGHVIVKHIREYIASGKIGKIRTVMAEYPQGWLAHEGESGGKAGSWRCDPSQSGGVNCLGDLGTHVENAVATMTGLKIKRVLAKMDVVVPGRVLDDNDVVLLEYEGGATGCYWSSQFAIGHANDLRVRIYGEKGSILWSLERSEHVTVIEEDGTTVTLQRGGVNIDSSAAAYNRLPAGHAEGWLESMANLYRSYVRCVRAYREGNFTHNMIDYPTVKDGLDGIKFIEACLKSQKEGNIWIEV